MVLLRNLFGGMLVVSILITQTACSGDGMVAIYAWYMAKSFIGNSNSEHHKSKPIKPASFSLSIPYDALAVASSFRIIMKDKSSDTRIEKEYSSSDVLISDILPGPYIVIVELLNKGVVVYSGENEIILKNNIMNTAKIDLMPVDETGDLNIITVEPNPDASG